MTVILQRTLNKYRGGFIDLCHLAEDMGHCPAVVDVATESSSYLFPCFNIEFTH